MDYTTVIQDLDNKISYVNTKISEIDGETGVTDPTILGYLSEDRKQHENTISRLNNKKTRIQTMQAQEGYTSEQQTVVDGINTLFPGVFDKKLDNFCCKDASTKSNFFTLYALADNDFLRETVLNHYFRDLD